MGDFKFKITTKRYDEFTGIYKIYMLDVLLAKGCINYDEDLREIHEYFEYFNTEVMFTRLFRCLIETINKIKSVYLKRMKDIYKHRVDKGNKRMRIR